MAGGLYQGFTYGFGGAEKAGKTTLAHTISFNLDAAGCKHLYIALEMGSVQIEQRNMARRLNVNSLEFIRPSPELIMRAAKAAPSENIVYLDAPGATLADIMHEIGVARIRHEIKGFILDYWQLVGGANPRDNEERHTRHVAQTVADYGRRHGLWCILMAQMNTEGRLFGGGGLRKACDQLYFIEPAGDGCPEGYRWLRMDATRYTPKADVGSADNPSLSLNKKVGPFFEEL